MVTKTLEFDNEVKLTIGEDKAFILDVISMMVATLVYLFKEAKIDILKEAILMTLVFAFKEVDEDVKIYYNGEKIKE